jgi:hypothetical protein
MALEGRGGAPPLRSIKQPRRVAFRRDHPAHWRFDRELVARRVSRAVERQRRLLVDDE